MSDKQQSESPYNTVITIDGPSGAGKGTLSLKLSKALDFQLLDSGALYRIIGLKAYKAGLIDSNTDNNSNKRILENQLEALTRSLQIDFVLNSNTDAIDILVNKTQIGADIRNETVGGYASKVAIFPKVRQALLDLQRDMARRSCLIADGRDMGTIVFPNATAKIFLTATAEARAQRRVEQLTKAGQVANKLEILSSIIERDKRDEGRTAAPSIAADDALILDSSTMGIEEVYQAIQAHCISKGVSFS